MSRRRLAALAALLLAVGACAPEAPPDFGPMATYQLALIWRGPEWTPERTPRTDSLQAGHMANIQRMAEARKLRVAGPFLDGGNLRGIYVFSADSAEAAGFAAEDPAVRAGRLRLDFHPMLAFAGLGDGYWEAVAKDSTLRDSLERWTFGLYRKGARRDQGEREAAKIQREHLRHLRRSLDSGKLRMPGSLLDDAEVRGILVFACDSTEARALCEADPAVRAGRLSFELHPWMTGVGAIPKR